MNFFRTALLFAAWTVVFISVGFALGGRTGALIALTVAAVTNVFAYRNAGRSMLAQQDAWELDENSGSELFAIVGALSERAQLQMLRIYIVNAEQPNAFAVGRHPDNAAIALSSGLLRLLSREEVTGVLAHELAHVKNRDTLTMAIAATIGGAILTLAQFDGSRGKDREGERRWGGWFVETVFAIVFVPVAAFVVRTALSRSQEYDADKLAGELCQRPLWLASALIKIERAAREIPNETAELYPASAHMFIINPLMADGNDSWFATHPDTAYRIAALVEQARAMGQTQRESQTPIGAPRFDRGWPDDSWSRDLSRADSPDRQVHNGSERNRRWKRNSRMKEKPQKSGHEN